MNTFDREAFGRRSFSEKRKASNGKSKEVVDKVKALREELKGIPSLSLLNAHFVGEVTRSSQTSVMSSLICYYSSSTPACESFR